MNEKAIELFEKAQGILSGERPIASPKNYKDAWEDEIQREVAANRIINQALALLKQQPPAGEFTKKIRAFIKLYENELPKRAEITFLEEACDRLDTVEALNAELLAACRVGLSYINALKCKVPRPILELKEDNELIESIIAKYQSSTSVEPSKNEESMQR
ncbi:MAG TPA: hypothetical protein VMW91_10435 [Desulfosporosinus sp.]|nr:hypothetical protein [Desulfosporosinus sp.]